MKGMSKPKAVGKEVSWLLTFYDRRLGKHIYNLLVSLVVNFRGDVNEGSEPTAVLFRATAVVADDSDERSMHINDQGVTRYGTNKHTRSLRRVKT